MVPQFRGKRLGVMYLNDPLGHANHYKIRRNAESLIRGERFGSPK